MTSLNKMYDGVANSPDTFLTSPLASGGNIMYVADSSVFGTLPNLAVLGSGANAETVLILSKRSDQGLNIQRAVEGVARDWAKASIVARNFTNYDYKQLKENIEKINNSKQESLTAGSNIQITNGKISATDTKYDDTQIKRDITALKNSQLAKANQTEAESGVDNTKYMTPQTTKQAIEKLSPKQDLSGYALKTEIKTKLSEMEDDNTHRTVTDTEKEKWNNTKTTEVVDNLTTDDGTKALSTRQGKVLQDNKADKSDISKCKTKGYDTSSTWQTLGTTRDLEDWIGDFDKRTRELKSGGKPDVFNRTTGGGTGFIKFIKNGNMVTVHVSMTASNETNQSVQQEFYVDEKFRPHDSFVAPLVNGALQINNSGLCVVFLVRVYNSSSSIDGVVTYVANSAYSN